MNDTNKGRRPGRRRSFKLCAYSEAGTSHIRRGKGCEDMAAAGIDPATGVAVAAVSDGAGSCTFASEGAQITARAALDYVLGQFDALYEQDGETFANGILGFIRSELMGAAEMLHTDITELSATLLLTAIAPDGRYLYLHVGDGLIVACNAEAGAWIMSQYHHTIAPNFTTFVTVPDTEYDYGKGRGGIDGFLLCSDGPELAFTDEEGFALWCEPLLRSAFLFTPARMERELRRMVLFLKNEGMYDDCTIITLADRTRSAGIYATMTPAQQQEMFRSMECRTSREAEALFAALTLLTAEPAGVSLGRLTRVMHLHKPQFAARRLWPLVRDGILAVENGRYRF